MRAPPGDVLRSIAFYTAFYLGTLVLVITALCVLIVSRTAFIRVAEAWSAFHRFCVVRLLGIRVALRGEIPSGPIIVAIKHESMFEAADLPNLLDLPVVFGKAELLDIPLWGRVADIYGVVRVEREAGAKALRAMVSAARKLSGAGRPLAIFPEDTRVPHGTQPPLQAGFAGLYKLMGLPVVPVAIDSGALYHRRWKRRGTITYVFGETIPPHLPREEIEARVHAAINTLNPKKPS